MAAVRKGADRRDGSGRDSSRKDAPRKAPARKKPAARRSTARGGVPSRLRSFASAALLVVVAAGGYYLTDLYAEITALIEARSAALSSSILSAPHRLRSGDSLEHSQLLDRLASLSYSAVAEAQNPGEYSRSKGALSLFLRGFEHGPTRHSPELVRLALDGERIVSVSAAEGGTPKHALLEPEAIGRLVPGAPAERLEIRLEDQKPYLVEGLLAVEDQLFYWHPGFNPVRIVQAAIRDLRARKLEAGASTLTQQLARTFMERRERTLDRKLRELAVALVLEFRFTKQQILERYINDVDLGAYEGAPIRGMPQAARYFFGKDLAQVTPAEAAVLIGMVQAPTLFDPRRNVEASTRRRDVVLAVMLRDRIIDDAAYATAINTPLRTTKAPGLRRAPHFSDYVISLLGRIPGIDGNFAGLKVYTTLDTEIQGDAVAAVGANLEKLEKTHRRLQRTNKAEKLQSSALVLDARTGAIRALVGGRNYSESQFNRVTSALRQPGSAFKPLVYLAALDPQRSPVQPPLTLASLLPNVPMSFGGWTPDNYERDYHSPVTAIEALSHSFNIPAAYVGSRLGPALMVQTAHELGIRQDLQAYLPISIGAGETTMLELTSSYQVLANQGSLATPYAIDSVVDAEGRLVYQHVAEEKRVVDPAVAYIMTSALGTVLTSGTGASARKLGLDFPAAGKTGTTQDYRDALFVGYTPELVCGVWVGFDQPQSVGLTAAQAALPAWVEIMRDSAPAEPRGFPIPPGVEMVKIDPLSGGRATQSCTRAMSLPFLHGTAPDEYCPLHGGQDFARGGADDARWGGWRGSDTPVAEAKAEEPKKPNVFKRVGGFFGKLFRR